MRRDQLTLEHKCFQLSLELFVVNRLPTPHEKSLIYFSKISRTRKVMKKSWKTFNQESGNPELMSSPEYDGGLFHTCVDPIYFIGFKSFRYTSRFVVKCFNLMCV